jgi:hypothetical protein
MFKQLMILFGLIFCIQNLYSQNITGTWEGLMSDEYFKLSVKQQGSQLCGQTFDVVIDNKKNYCKAYCTGQYDKTLQIWYLKGIQFIENSGEHVLMTIKIWKTDNVNSKIMMANITTSDSPLDFFGLETGENLWIRKISNTPQKLAKKLPVCFQKQKTIPEKKIQIKKDNEEKKKKIEPLTIKKIPEQQLSIKDSLHNITIPTKADPSKVSDMFLFTEMNNRQNNVVSKLTVNTPKIELKIYDNGIVDNDTVSIFFDNKLIVSHQKLTAIPIKIELDVSDSNKTYELVMFAENLGSFPPNTALVVVTAGKKRYEFHSSANLNENAKLQFNYHPSTD